MFKYFAKFAKKYAIPILVLSAVVFFIFFRLSIVNQIWSDRSLPPEPDDSFAYVAGVKTVGDSGYYFFDFIYGLGIIMTICFIYLGKRFFYLSALLAISAILMFTR